MSFLFPGGPFRATTRRSFLTAAVGSLAAASVWANRAEGALRRRAKFSDNPFSLGVASGDPTPSGVVLWTRLAPKPLEGGGMPNEAVEVGWEVAEDESFSKIVQKGTTAATPDWAHSVHVEIDGLEPQRGYFYRFMAGDEVSPVGRTKTTPAADAKVDALKFAFASCQHFEEGLYTNYEHMLKEDVDLVFHLGDYIYEYKGRDKYPRKHVGNELDTLDDYRNRHAQYKTDPHLAEMHRQAPWIVTWDDHEFDNNCAGAISEQLDVKTEPYLARRARAYQAYYENMPLRKSAIPVGPDMKLYRKISYGPLADFYVLDTRQYRSDQPCGDGNKPQCPAALDPNTSVMGAEQEKWLNETMDQSHAQWNVLAQQIMMARVDRKAGEDQAYSMDQWPGYETNRQRVLQRFHERNVSNPVVIAGDIHSNWANDLIADFGDLNGAIVASEFVGTSISSGGNGVASPTTLPALLSENPFVKFHNAERGYVVCRVTPEQWRTDYRTVQFVDKPGAPLQTRASFVVENGRKGLQQA
ncbi:MAG TPA: alkaline phosphatase D family protein [Pirellulales bacterium]